MDDNDGYSCWVEEMYCSPPLAMERKTVSETLMSVEHRREWERIRGKPLL
jgi:hypothetical protein